MSAYRAIAEALDPLDIPVRAEKYTGSENVYVVYRVNESRGDVWGDEEPDAIVDQVEIDLYSPILWDAGELTRTIRKLISKNPDFTFPRIEHTSDPENYIKCERFTCQYIES